MNDVAGMMMKQPPDPSDPGGQLAARMAFRHPGMPAALPAIAGSARNLVSPSAWTAYLQSLLQPLNRGGSVGMIPQSDRETLAKEPGVMP